MGKRKTNNQDRKKKVALVFDESQRKDYLCGFRKRKLERKKKAQEEMQRMMKEEVKRIKQENKESYKKLIVSSRPLPDIEQLLKEEYEDDDVNVKIVELSTDTLQKKDLVIGENRPKEIIQKSQPKKNKDNGVIQEVPGMGLDEDSNEENEDEAEDEDKDNNSKTKKELKRMLKHQATKKIQKSKVFQMKSKLDRVQMKKKAGKRGYNKDLKDRGERGVRGRTEKGHNNMKGKGEKGHKGRNESRKDKSNKKKIGRKKHK